MDTEHCPGGVTHATSAAPGCAATRRASLGWYRGCASFCGCRPSSRCPSITAVAFAPLLRRRVYLALRLSPLEAAHYGPALIAHFDLYIFLHRLLRVVEGIGCAENNRAQ